jgi:predicted DNA binding protein
MEGNFLKVAKLAVFHSDCFASETTGKFPEVELKQVSPVHVLGEHSNRIDYQYLSEIKAPSKASLENYLRAVKRFRDMRQLRVLAKKEKSALALFRVNAESSSTERVVRRGGMHLEPVSSAGGYEIHTVISPKPAGIAKLLNELSELGEIKVLKIGKPAERKSSGLTEKQLKALEIAMSSGYYSWPRGATIEELAGLAGVSRRAFQERLRKAESKVFPRHIQDLVLDLNTSPVS